MGAVTPDAIEAYLAAHAPRRDRVLLEMEAKARRERIPIVGPLVGTVLFQMASMIRARRVFECGSAIGYSTVWLARAVGPRGRVFYTESDPGRISSAEGYLRRAGVLSRVTMLKGEALKSMKRTPGAFDAVFNDVDKGGYPGVWKEASGRIRPGGLFLSDNTLWSGAVLDGEGPIVRFNDHVAADPRTVQALLSIRDGMTLIRLA